jgi:hypothetical protein
MIAGWMPESGGIFAVWQKIPEPIWETGRGLACKTGGILVDVLEALPAGASR